MKNYILNNYGISLEGQVISPDLIVTAVNKVNNYFETHTTDEDIIVFNAMLEGGALSSTIGSLFNSHLESLSDGSLIRNPVKGGNPDVLNLGPDEAKKKYEYYTSTFGNNVNVWDPKVFGYINKYPYGGIETKCTSINKPAKTMKNCHIAFGWGDQRIKYNKSFGWSAHHNDNDNLCGIVWDFVNGLPTIVAVMYSDELLKEDWGKPHKTEGNKSTNGFGLNKDGIDKMKKGWLCVLDDPDYTNAFNFQFRENDVVMKPVVNRWQREIELW